MHEFELVGGPQDGGKVRGVSMPLEVFVGPKWLGDGYVAWGREWCNRFPCCYEYCAGRFVFRVRVKH